ncbi:MAG: hypothetical protein FMNOHCHN_00753 [Ignavibacteriaceae bacterium]|nr:hypothetical protein [Ignavibacteriaceae bacterium]MCK6615015.1 LptF/LptG family permease [Ignavibacteriaceae bacterium]
MKILDRYLLKQFGQTVFFGLLAFTSLFVVIDLMENLDDFIDNNVISSIIFEYYIMFIPEIIKLMLPVSVLFAALFTTGKMANLNELTAIKAGGVSMFRYMLPILIVCFFISVMAVYFSGYIVPLANKRKINIEMNYLNKGYSFAGSNIFFQDSPTRIVSISYFDEPNNNALRVSIQDFDENDLTIVNQRFDAGRMFYDTLSGNWVMPIGYKRTFTDSIYTTTRLDSFPLSDLNFKPADLASKQLKPEEMNLGELQQFIADQIRAGNDVRKIEIEYYSRYSFAFTSLIIVLFGLPFSANKRKGGVALQIGINILITFIYLVMMKIIQAFGKNGSLDPIMTAWMVNFIFLAASLLNLTRLKQ